MKRLVCGFIVVGLATLFYMGGQTIEAQEGRNRLQIHGAVNLLNKTLYAVCDTGNGTMIYVADASMASFSEATRGIAIMPNGCEKTK